MDSTNSTLFGGKNIAVLFEDGKTDTLQVQQLRLRQYESAFTKLDDEIEFVAFACGKTKAQIETLQPESYELAVTTVREVNAKGFFPFAVRRRARSAESLQNLPPGVLEKMFATHMAAFTSQPQRPFMPPPAA